MDPGFGARLRAQREERQVSLSAISEDTKIKLSMLEGLERDDVSQWPEGIYRRAYVRAYARAIGLDPETLVREFLEVHPDPVITALDTNTELENPPWPVGFHRLVTSARAAVPTRRQRDERGGAEPVQPEVHTAREDHDIPVHDDRGPAPDSALSAVADDNGHPGADESAELAYGSSSRPEPGLAAAAELCTRLGRVLHRRECAPILEDAAAALDAVGLILWSWNSREGALRPWLGCGYTDAMLARMPGVRADADNAIAAAFRSARACVVKGGDGLTGAVVVPLISHSGCVGVLAVELRHGDEERESVQAFATILAAQFVAVLASVPLAEAMNA